MGKIELDHTGSGGGVTLSSDGTDLLLDGTAIGGGGADLYAENPSSPTAPSATGTNAVAIGDGASATNNYSLAIGGTASASNSTAVAIGYGATASSGSSLALGRAASATTGGFNTALGYNAVSAGSGGNATALTNSYASGANSFAAAIANNTSSYGAQQNNSIAIGLQSKSYAGGMVCIGNYSLSSNTFGVALGSYQTASGYGAVSIGSGGTAGYTNIASGTNSTVLGGIFNEASAQRSVALGSMGRAEVIGQMTFGSGAFQSKGKAQSEKYILVDHTTDATPSILTTNNGTASTNNQFKLDNASSYTFTGKLIARSGDDIASFLIHGAARKGTTAASATLINSATTVISNTQGWGFEAAADTTNGAIKFTVTGDASKTIRWVLDLETVKVRV